MKINAIISHLEYMLHHFVGLGAYEVDIKEAIMQLRIYSSRLEYEESSGYNNALDLFNDTIKDLNDRIDVLKEEEEHWRNLAVKRNDELEKLWEMYYQLKKTVKKRDIEYELMKKYYYRAKNQRDAMKRELSSRAYMIEILRERLSKKEKEVQQISETLQRERLKEPEHIKVNNPQYFCGNCRYCRIDPNEEVAVCAHPSVRQYWIDPDDASCPAFLANQVNKVVICKPEFPCCDHCNHEDCDNCTLCPF